MLKKTGVDAGNWALAKVQHELFGFVEKLLNGPACSFKLAYGLRTANDSATQLHSEFF